MSDTIYMLCIGTMIGFLIGILFVLAILKTRKVLSKRQKEKEKQAAKKKHIHNVQNLDMQGLEPICSSYSGRIIAINVCDGEEVKKGKDILILDSMKMEIPIRTSKGGIVRLHCEKFQNINRGDPLFSIL